MTTFRRFRAVCAILAFTAVVTCSTVWGEPDRKPRLNPLASGSKTTIETTEVELAGSKFSKGGVVTYRTMDNVVLFALGVKPKLDPVLARPLDYLIMVDTSASQFGAPLATAEKIAAEIVANAKAVDRIALWTVNIPKATRDLTHGFQTPRSAEVQDAVKELRNEVPLGDTDLKGGLERAIKSFGGEANRQRVIVFLGDGMSIHNPMTAADRAQLCDSMVKNEIAVFPVPVGPLQDPQNLHGLASGTGGLLVRVLPQDQLADTMKRLEAAVAAPILYPTSFQLPAKQVTEYFPTKLPPLRPDASTLVVGRFQPGKALAYTVEGTVAGKPVRLSASEPVTEPEMDNFFLVSMVDQWKNAKDSPALMEAGRALAYAQEVNQMARAELLAQAEMALAQDNMVAAQKLFEQVQKLDPNDVEAAGGLKMVGLILDGKVDRKQLRRQLVDRDGQGIRIDKDAKGAVRVRRDRLKDLVAQAEKEAAQPPAPAQDIAPGVDQTDILKQQQLRLAVAEQRATQIVDDAIRQARRILPTDPDAARDLLKRVLAGVRDDPDLTERTRQTLSARLEGDLRGVDLQGRVIKRNEEERVRLLAAARERIDLIAEQTKVEELTIERMRAFRNLMNQARYLDAYRQAQSVIMDAVNQGNPVPVAATGGYQAGTVAYAQKEMTELRRLREEKYLAAMMQVERSAVPFPDEPPVVFPPAAAWKRLTEVRKERYESSGFTDDDPITLKKVRDLRDKMAQPVTFEFPGGPLKEALEYLSDRYGVTILIDTEAFKSDLMIPEVETTQVKVPKLVGVSLSTALRLLLAQAQGTYIIRRDYIEVTTGQRQAAEKVLRVYPVADLVIPIPNAVNQQGLQQNLQVLGSTVTVNGVGIVGGAAGLAIAGGGLAGLGGGLGGIGGLAGIGGAAAGLGGIGALGVAGGGALGVAGGGIGGAAGFAGNVGFGGGQNAVNQGFGGGFTGFGGGQQGQFGNLGGQFGLQGGDTSAQLISLIRQVVGEPRDWAPLTPEQQAALGRAPGGLGAADDKDAGGDPNQSGSIGYYQPARALVVKATSRIHTSVTGGLLGPRQPALPGAGMGALDQNKPGAIVMQPGQHDKPIQIAAGDHGNDKRPTDPKDKGPAKTLSDVDAKKAWQEALAQGVNDPGLIIACSDFLAQHQKFDHAAEFLKANLRQGVVAQAWVYEALAIALKESKGSLDDIERCQLSAIDFAPQDSQGYLRASKAMAENKRYDRAVAFCRQASLLDPNSAGPYAEALLYAELDKNPDAMEWAAGNLLSRDWPLDNQELHDKASAKLQSLAKRLGTSKGPNAGQDLLAAVARNRERDLVIQLTWQGEADLDLEVTDPVGTVCSFMQRQTPGGGTLLGDTLADTNQEAYVAAEAFSGEYHVMVRRVWGKPFNSKATLRIIQHQGTPRETQRLETVVFDRTTTLKVNLDGGRRTSLAQVSPDASYRPAETAEKQADQGGNIINKLRGLVDPDLGLNASGLRGGTDSLGAAPVEPQAEPPPSSGPGQITYQGRVSPFVTNSVDLTAQAAISADRRFVRLSLAPVFQGVTRVQPALMVNNPLIPGGLQGP